MADVSPSHTVATDRALDLAARRHDLMIERLEHLVTIPSVSAAPAPPEAVRDSADAVAELLVEAGLEHVHQASVGDSHPYVIGDWLHRDGAPTVLLYAHHDVQPPGIIENWASDPFTPRQAHGRLFGRGSADDKAGAIVHAAAIAAWLEAEGELPCNVRVMIEGEEEIGSPNLDSFLAENIDDLAADVLVLADAGNWKVGTPAITYALRGVVGLDIEVRALAGPVHSGLAGGVVPDPTMALSIALASLTDALGEIAIPGFSNDIRPLSDDERQRLAALGEGSGLRRSFGVSPDAELTGDPAMTVWERLWFRPALTIIGFDSHPIDGSSNQIVARATARLSFRLAAGQDPARALRLITEHLQAHVPWHLPVTITPHESAPGWVCEPQGWAFAAADLALQRGFGTAPVHMGIGGSIPFVGPFADAFGGIPALLLGPADPTSAIHGENESVHLGDLAKLTASEIHLLAALAAGAPATS